jgi:hypothetical protein
MARIGSVAAAPFVGDQFVSLYLGATRVPTVPDKPAIASAGVANNSLFVGGDEPDDGGSAIEGYNLYVNGVRTVVENNSLNVFPNSGAAVSDTCRVSAVNAIGEGPLSDPLTVTVA